MRGEGISCLPVGQDSWGPMSGSQPARLMAGEGQQPGNGCRLLFQAVQQERTQEEEHQQQTLRLLVHFFRVHHEEHGLLPG